MNSFSNICKVVAVAAGKGGVGKSTLSLHLARYYASKGYQVGLMDADIYGPSMQKMLPEEIPPSSYEDRIIPAQSSGIKLISMAYFLKDGEAASVRAPIVNGVIKQFIHSVDWGELDYLIIDFPPGTGDIQLTLLQEAVISGAVLVTTPQEIALLDVAKTMAMFRQMQVPIAGLVENMSYCMVGDQKIYPFGNGGGERFAHDQGIFFLGSVPIDGEISRACDRGLPLQGGVQENFARIGELVEEQLEAFDKLKGVEIQAIHQNDRLEFTIEWTDGKLSHYIFKELQRRCNCAACSEKKREQVEEDVEGIRIENVGNYALKITFSSGCSKGIYPVSFLRRS